MSWRKITNPESIRAAIKECDRLGRDAFLTEYGYGKATKYALIVNDKRYDPKAILGVAHKYEFGYPLHRDQVKKAKARRQKFKELGFTIIEFQE